MKRQAILINISYIILLALFILLPTQLPAISPPHSEMAAKQSTDQKAIQAKESKKDKEAIKNIFKLFSDKKYDDALVRINRISDTAPLPLELIQLKYNILMIQKKHNDALAFLDKEIKRSGETVPLLAAKEQTLVIQQKFADALDVALKKDEITEEKNPWDAIGLMNICIELNKNSDALDWFHEAVNRGFINYRMMSDKKFRVFRRSKEFIELIELIKLSIGLGEKAKDFKVTLMSGKELTLPQLRGKVVLVNFWATWCKPCVAEMPQLQELYNKYKGNGFELVAISLDSNRAILNHFIETRGLTFKMAYSGKEWADETVKKYRVNVLPSHWLIDRNGVLRSFDIKEKKLEKAIQLLIAEK